MPMYVDENEVIVRITFDRPACEPPLKESWVRKLMDNLWFLIYGGVR